MQSHGRKRYHACARHEAKAMNAAARARARANGHAEPGGSHLGGP